MLPPDCIWRMKKIHRPMISRNGAQPKEELEQWVLPRLLGLDDHASVPELRDQVRVLGQIGEEAVPGGVLASFGEGSRRPPGREW